MTSNFITGTIKISIIDSLCKLITWTFHNILLIFAIFNCACAYKFWNCHHWICNAIPQCNTSTEPYWYKYYDSKLNFDTDYKSGQQGLQNGAERIKNRGRFKDYKTGQKDYKSGQRLQNGAKRLQSGAGITNGCRTKWTLEESYMKSDPSNVSNKRQ